MPDSSFNKTPVEIVTDNQPIDKHSTVLSKQSFAILDVNKIKMNNRHLDEDEETSDNELQAVAYTALSIIGVILFSILIIFIYV